MLTLPAIAERLRDTAKQQGLTQARLAESAGVAPRTLTHVLSGQEDFRLSTLMALADRLGLELLLVPKGAAAAVAAGEELRPPVRSVVTQALDALHDASDAPDATGTPLPRGGRDAAGRR